MDEGTITDVLASSLDDESLKQLGLVFGQWTSSGFTLEHGDEKFKVTVTKQD